MMHLLDWFVLFLYLGLVCLLGVYFTRRNHNFKAYMFGGGSVPWIAVGISLIATSVSATTFLGNPADAFANNMTYLMCNIGGILSLIVISVVFIPKIRGLNVQSAYELLEIKFSPAVRKFASALYCMHLLLRTGILLYGPALVLATILGINIYMAILLISLLAILYTLFGGIRAVIWTDVLQFVVLLAGGIIVLFVASKGSGGICEMWSLASEAGKTKWLDFSLDPGNARTFLSAGIIYTVFEVAIRGCDQQFVQRYLSTKSIATANYSSILSVFLGILVSVLFFAVGASLYVYYRVSLTDVLPEGISTNEVFPFFILHSLPAGVTGLMVAAIMAAAMSSLDSALTALSNTSVMDFKFSFNRSTREGDDNLLYNARIWIVLWGLLGIGAAFICVAGEKSLLSKALFFTSLFTGPLLGMFIFAFYISHVNSKAVLYGSLFGMSSLLPFSNIPYISPDFWSPVYNFSWPWNPLISLTATVVGILAIDSLFFRKKRLNEALGCLTERERTGSASNDIS